MKNKGLWFTVLPLYLFTIVFIAGPLMYLVVLSFLTKAEGWGVENNLTLDNYIKITNPVYLQTFLTSFKLACLTTIVTLVAGYPFGYIMARLGSRAKRVVMMLVIIPFWTNALVRIYGWVIIFRSNGLLDQLLMGVGLTDSPLRLLYSYPAVVIGMIYSLLPFMILSVYSSAEKMDYTLVEAARDLGAGKIRAFLTITVKQTMPGIMSGVVLTFIPSMGLFFIAEKLGGGKIMLVGNLIKDEIYSSRNWPFAAALSVVLMVFTSLLIHLYKRLSGGKELEGLL